MKIKKIKCVFKDYGETEKVCVKCGYVIPNSNDNLKTIEWMVNSGFQEPICGVEYDKSN